MCAPQIFAFENAADTPRWKFNLTTVQCGLNDPSNGVFQAILAYNTIKGKFTAAKLQALTSGGASITTQDFSELSFFFPLWLLFFGLLCFSVVLLSASSKQPACLGKF